MNSYAQIIFMQSYINIKNFLLLLLAVLFLFIFFFFVIGTFREQLASCSGVITALVTINPLEVDVSTPTEVKIDKTFMVRAEIKNKGETKIDEVKAEIFLPDELELVRKDKEQGIKVLRPQQKRFIFWFIRGKEVGNYIISVKASGELKGELISIEDSTMVKIRKRASTQEWFQGYFDFLREWFSY